MLRIEIPKDGAAELRPAPMRFRVSSLEPMHGQMMDQRRLWPGLKERFIRFSGQLDGFDVGFLIVLTLSCFLYHHPLKFWSGAATIGNWQYGDAEFWWNGALQFAEGIVANNVNLTYRMGYAAIAGLWIALFGTRFAAFHTFLLFELVGVLYLLYISLRPSLGKIAAAAGILLLALNPMTAEWFAISTSDSVGLLLNLVAMIFLVTALTRELSPVRLAACGLFIALASLTRPLMTPFLGVALVLTLCAIHVPWPRRWRGILALLAAFMIPTALWIGVLRSVTGAWNLAGSESSTFYAASDPNIQVWNPGMYAAVKDSAERRFGVPASDNQVDQEFQRLTALNYRKYVKYHIRRFPFHIRAIAGVSIEDAAHVNSLSRRLRYLILGMVGIGLIVPLLRKKRFALAAVAFLVLAAWLYHPLYWAVVLIAMCCAIPLALWNKSASGGAVFVGYWVVGMLALYLIGGTWGAADGSSVALNALGYRLGFQFFFASDLVVLYFIHNICTARVPGALFPHKAGFAVPGSSGKWTSIAVAAICTWLALTALEVAAGSAVVLSRGVERNMKAPQAFPELASALAIFKGTVADPRVLDGVRVLTGEKAQSFLTPNVDTPYVLTTAASTDFIWNLEGQQRTKVNVALQTELFPFQFQPRLFVDFPMQLQEQKWARRQGAWLLRRFSDEPLVSNFPWYFSDVAVRAFVPVSQSRYDVSKVQWFQLPKYASQLYHAKQLDIQGAKLQFVGNSGILRYPRRFAITLDTAIAASSPSISMDVAKASGRRDLTFGWQFELAPGEQPRQLAMELQGFHAGRKVSDEVRESPADSALPPQAIRLNLNQPAADRVLIQFGALRPGETIWIYELNVIADEWDW